MILAVTAWASIVSAPAAPAVRVVPAEAVLPGLYAEQRLIVLEQDAGKVRDVTAEAKFEVKGPFAVEEGVVRARSSGNGSIIVRYGRQQREVRVSVSEETVSNFSATVQPVLAKGGCAARACHGAEGGQAGFALTLFNVDPSADARAIAADGHRVNVGAPEKSLVLLKPTASVTHGGGRRFSPDSAAARALVEWISSGAKPEDSSAPSLTDLSIHLPVERFTRENEQCRVLVTATFSKGVKKDVTGLSSFSTTDDGVATVTDDGVVTALRRGDAYLIARYGRYITSTPIFVDIPLRQKPPVIARYQPTNEIDRVLAARWERMGIAPSSVADDYTFVRRVYLDLIGTLPKPEEVLAYVNSRSPRKKEELVDSLLRRPEFIFYWTQWWGDMLRIERNTMREAGVRAFSQYIRTSLLNNKPLDQMAREMLTATGRTFADGPANYFRPTARVEDAVVQFSRVFMGVRMDCAQCHNHPHESWTQNDFYNLAMFFRQTRLRAGPNRDEVTVENLQQPAPLNIPRRATRTPAVPILPGAREPVKTDKNLRELLAEWLTSPDNEYFARAFANRLWARMMGRGVFEPLDDYRRTNPPSDPALMDALTHLLREKGFDMRAFLREIALSRAYSLTSDTNPSNEKDNRFFSHYYPRRVPAEVLADMIAQATNRPDRYNGYPEGTRAIELEEPNTYSRILTLFNRPNRRVVTCQRDDSASLSQALFLLNNGAVHNKIVSREGIVVELLSQGKTPDEVITELYLRTLCRPPKPEEREVILRELAQTNRASEVLQDVLWALINTKEFLYNH